MKKYFGVLFGVLLSYTVSTYARESDVQNDVHEVTNNNGIQENRDPNIGIFNGDIYEQIALLVDDVKGLRNLKNVSELSEFVTSSVPGGDSCQLLHFTFTIDQHKRKATVKRYALYKLLGKLIPRTVKLRSTDSRDFVIVQEGLKTFHACINQLWRDGYTVTGLDPDDVRHFRKLGRERSRVRFRPTMNFFNNRSPDPYWNMINNIVTDHNLADTSLGLAILKSKVELPDFAPLVTRLMPTRNPQMSSEGIRTFVVNDDEEYRDRSLELAGAIKANADMTPLQPGIICSIPMGYGAGTLSIRFGNSLILDELVKDASQETICECRDVALARGLTISVWLESQQC